MKARKVSLVIKIEVLSIDSVRSLLCDMNSAIADEKVTGRLVADDGDTIEWETTYKDVEF